MIAECAPTYSSRRRRAHGMYEYGMYTVWPCTTDAGSILPVCRDLLLRSPPLRTTAIPTYPWRWRDATQYRTSKKTKGKFEEKLAVCPRVFYFLFSFDQSLYLAFFLAFSPHEYLSIYVGRLTNSIVNVVSSGAASHENFGFDSTRINRWLYDYKAVLWCVWLGIYDI